MKRLLRIDAVDRRKKWQKSFSISQTLLDLVTNPKNTPTHPLPYLPLYYVLFNTPQPFILFSTSIPLYRDHFYYPVILNLYPLSYQKRFSSFFKACPTNTNATTCCHRPKLQLCTILTKFLEK